MQSDSETTINPASFHLILWARVATGFFLLSVMDLIAGYLVPGPSLEGIGEVFAMVTLVMGRGACVGLVTGFAFVFILGFGRLLHRERGEALLLFFLGLGIFVYLNQETFSGAKIQSHPRLHFFKLALYLGGTLGIISALFLAKHVHDVYRKSVRLGPVYALIGLAVGQVLLWQNVVRLPGLYWMLHTQLTLLAAVVITLGPASWLIATKKRAIPAIALTLLLTGGAIWVRTKPVMVRVASAAFSRGVAVREFQPLVTWLLDRVSKKVDMRTGGVPHFEIPRSSAADEDRAQSMFHGWMGSTTPYNVLYLAVDTLRADHCGFNGYQTNPTTPNLDSLAKDAFVFSRAYAPYPTSNLSYASILTGLSPRATSTYARMKQKSDRKTHPLTSTPALLRSLGYKTIGITAFNRATSQNDDWFGLLRDGFEVYNPEQKEEQLSADLVVESVKGQLAILAGKPFFMWAHFLDPHNPYKKWPGFDFGESKLQRYDGEIGWTDKNVGDVIQRLKDLDLFDKTIIVMFSDHGEEFNEHGGWFHNSNVYQEQVRVPLMIRVPKAKGRVIDTVVSLTDLHPTITQLLGVSDPVERLGHSLLPIMAEVGKKQPGIAYIDHFYLVSRKDFDNKKAVVFGNKKLIHYVQRESYELFDLKEDPKERRNLVGRRDDLFSEMRGLLEAFDREIDSYHLGEGEEPADPRKEFRHQVELGVSALLNGDGKDKGRSFAKLSQLLFLGLGELSPKAQRFMSGQERFALAKRIYEGARGIKSERQRDYAVKILGKFKDRELIAELESFYQDTSFSVRLSSAKSLGLMGVDSAKPYLIVALRSGFTDPTMLAPALTRLGAVEAGHWVLPTLLCPNMSVVGEMILQLPFLKFPNLGFYTRNLITEGRWSSRLVQTALAQSLAKIDDEDFRWHLRLLAESPAMAVRQAARAALKVGGLSLEDLAQSKEAAVLELDGGLEVKNRVFHQAFQHWRASLEKNSYFNPGLRFRLARYLHLEGDRDGARQVLLQIEKNAPRDLDRDLAKRRLQFLEWPARIMDPKNFGLSVTKIDIPKTMRFKVPTLIKVTVKNTGRVAIQGGFWLHRANFLMRWSDKNGDLLPQEIVWDNFLPDAGLLPQEELEIRVMIMPPPAPQAQAQATLIFEQPWLRLENPRIYLHSQVTSFTR